MKEWATGVCGKYAVRPGFVTGVAKWTAVSGYEGQGRARMRSDSVGNYVSTRVSSAPPCSCLRLTTPGEGEKSEKWSALFMRQTPHKLGTALETGDARRTVKSVYNYEAANWERMSVACPVEVETISGYSPIRRSHSHT
jgi:hypothetical protein